ncbi:hypothetical protein JCM14076_15450 [Methylosoma difficile]
MKIGLINTHSYNNVGDAATYAALAQLLNGHEVYANLMEAQAPIPSGIHNQRNLNQCDSFVSVGGDVFNNTRPWFVTKKFLNNLNLLGKKPNTTFLFGQSIPASCNGPSLKLLASQLKRINSVTVRDQQSYKKLSEMGVNCKLSFDTSFVLQCSAEAERQADIVLENLEATRSAVISLREFNSLYPANNEIFVRNIGKLCRKLLEYDYQPVLLIQSKVSEKESDWVVAKAIMELCPGAKVLDLLAYQSTVPSWELLQAVLKKAGLIVAVRYHTAILALAAGRVPYNLYYSNKGADLCERLKIPGGFIGNFNPDYEFSAITNTCSKSFNAEPIRRCLANDFKEALDNCSAYFYALNKHHEFA